jgi:hypothetical protein
MAVLLVVAILVALGGGRKPKKIHPGQPLPPQ